jgi:hypothetical protein
VKLARFKKPKAAYFLSYFEYRLNTNAQYAKQVKLRGGHIQEREARTRKLGR